MRNVLMFNYAKGHFLCWELAFISTLVFLRYFGGKMDLLLCEGKGSIFTSRFTFSFLRYAVGFLDRA